MTQSTDKNMDKPFSSNAMGLVLFGKDTATHQKFCKNTSVFKLIHFDSYNLIVLSTHPIEGTAFERNRPGSLFSVPEMQLTSLAFRKETSKLVN